LETDITNYPALLNTKTFAIFKRDQNAKLLPELCMELLSEQKKTWPDLGQGYESLKDIMEREIICNGFSVHVQHNPGRIRSTMADVQEKSVSKRSCFLCLNNLPNNQKGVLYRGNFIILCNPMPVFSGHFTLAYLDHQPQHITEHIDAFLYLMSDLGSNWSVLYNGPRCGASAPDHLHFQVIPSENIPIEKEISDENKRIQIAYIDGVQLSRAYGLGRELIILEGNDPAAIASAFKQIVSELKKIFNTDTEPMMNIIGSHYGETLRLLIFPRTKHRPAAFFREGNDRVAVSPAVIEMGGVLVTPVESDFEHLDASAVEGIFMEVSMKGEVVQNVVDAAVNSPHRPAL
jgi:hypothetical protein